MENLIPVHINTARDETHYYSWSIDQKRWIKGNEIPEKMKRMYNNPQSKSSYK